MRNECVCVCGHRHLKIQLLSLLCAELLCSKLPPVPEECPPNNTIATEELYRSFGNSFFNLAQQDSQPAKSQSPPRSMPSYQQPSYPKLPAPPSQHYNYQYSPPPPPPPPSSYQPKSATHNRQMRNYNVYNMSPVPPPSPPQSTYILPDQPPPPPPPLPPPPPSYSVSPPRMPTRSLSLPLTNKISLPMRRDDVFAVPKVVILSH